MADTVAQPLLEVFDLLGFNEAPGLVSHTSEPTSGAQAYAWQSLANRVGLEAAFLRDGVPLVARCPETFTFDLVQDLVCGFGPDEGVAAVIPAGDEGADLGHQV